MHRALNKRQEDAEHLRNFLLLLLALALDENGHCLETADLSHPL